jgi:virulence factor
MTLRIAMIGLGDIARKAYLPVLGPRADVDLVFVTRNADALAELGAAWRVDRLHADLDAALAEGLDGALVHAATAAHPDIVRRLLEAGVPTMVDKPLADNAADSEVLVDLAETRGVSLMVGFNRRFAPVYQDAAALDLPLDGHAEEPRRPGRRDAPRGVRRLHPRGRHPALPGPRRERGPGPRPGRRTVCCSTWPCRCRAAAATPWAS